MKVKFVHTSDVHGYLTAKSFTKEELVPYGLSRVKTIIDELEEDGSIVIYIDTGDTLQGSPLATYYVEEEKVEKLAGVYKKLNLDLWILGNHDFNYGQDYLEKAINAFEVDVLCANLEYDNKKLNIKPYSILEPVEGLRIGVLGLTTQYIPHWELADHIKGMKFKSALEAAKHYVPILKEKEKCDIIVAAYHGGFEKDLETDIPHTKLTGENEASAIIDSGLPIDIFLTGHQHRALAGQKEGIFYTQPGHKAEHVGLVELELDENNKIIKGSSSLIKTANYKPDESIEEYLQEDITKTIKKQSKVAGRLSKDLKVTNVAEAQLNGHPYIDFINQVQMDYMQVDIAGMCFFSETAPGLGEVVTLSDLTANYPFDNLIARLTLTGKELREYLEHNAGYFTLDEEGNLQITQIYKTPKLRVYAYDIFTGIDYTYDFSRKVGERLVNLTYQGKEVKDSDQLKVALNSYRAQGGGDVAVLDGSQTEEISDIGIHEMIFNYMGEQTVTEIRNMPSIKSVGYLNVKP